MQTEAKKQVYKVLSKNDEGQLYSALRLALGHQALHYPTDGSVVVPKIGKIMVFCNLYHAEEFRRYSCYSRLYPEIWHAEAYNVEEIGYILDCRLVGVLPDETLIQCWQELVSLDPKQMWTQRIYNPTLGGMAYSMTWLERAIRFGQPQYVRPCRCQEHTRTSISPIL